MLFEGQVKESDIIDAVRKDLDEKKYEEAHLKILRWLELAPLKPMAWLYLGYFYRQIGKIEASYAAYKRLLELDPENAQGLSNFGNLHVYMGDAPAAIPFLRKAYELEPDSHLYRENLAYGLRNACEYEETEELHRQIAAANPDIKKKQFDLGIVLLHQRKLEEGWELYEKRPRTEMAVDILGKAKAIYNGEPLKGKKILVIGEQGFGDTLLLMRFIKPLSDEAKQLDFITRKPLYPLLEGIGITCFDKYDLPEDLDVEGYDYVAESMSLAHLIEPDWMNWPETQKLPVPEVSKKKMDGIFENRPKKLNVGIVWSGSVTFQHNHIRSAGYERFLKLAAQHPDIQFYSLQKGPREQDMANHGWGTIWPIGQVLDNFGDTAAALEHMDLILMTDSGLAHLAGCQQVPVLNLLSFFHYWLYHPKENTTPIYPSWRFLRQESDGNWDPVFKKADKILKALGKKAKKAGETRVASHDILKIIDKAL